jgi:15-cis-phytoene synthase
MTVEESYRYSIQVARRRARNFYYSFVLLSPPQRKAICAIYAFMRYCDDLSDDETGGDRCQAIAHWKTALTAALNGRFSGHPVWPAFHDAVTRYRIPREYFFDMIAGVSSDLEPRVISTFDELYQYCYQVASVVGLAVIHIFGFQSREALELAEECGIAFQLTNILRDVREDAARGRIYLPAEDLMRFHVAPEELSVPEITDRFRELMRFEAARARAYYRCSAPLIDLVEPPSRPSLWALIEIYRTLLVRIEHSGYNVLNQRIRVPSWQKALIVLRAFARSKGVPPGTRRTG